MSKVQTFEEWWAKEGCLYMEDHSKPDAKMAWQAAMENAARVCDEQADSFRYEEGGYSCEHCAGEIREAAKR